MLYAITDRHFYGSCEAECRAHLLEQAVVWAANGVAFILLREKDLSPRDHIELARAMLQIVTQAIRQAGKDAGPRSTRLLIHGRPDIAIAAGAGGVHLPGGPDALTPSEVRSIFVAAGRIQPPYVSVSCHTLLEVERARQEAADCILFAPVFEKKIFDREFSAANQTPAPTKILPGAGLAQLEQACRAAAPVPVFALGGVTAENAAQCLQSGATGVAAIRLMQEPPLIWRHLA